jgi:hypothetical protein
MDWMLVLEQVFQICIFPILGALTIWVISLIDVKKQEILEENDNKLLAKYLNMLDDTITACVLATNQTYVDSLKKQGKFDVEAQKIAFENTYNAVLDILADDAFEYLSVAVGDLQTYITNKIEANVSMSK